MDESNNGRYDIILCRDLPNALGLDIKFSDNVIIGGDWLYSGCSSHMIYVKKYYFKSLTDKIVKLE